MNGEMLVVIFQTFLIAAGFIATIWNLALIRRNNLNAIEIGFRKNAMEMIGRYSDAELIRVRNTLFHNDDAQGDLHLCGALLNFFEEVAICVKHMTASETLLFDYFDTTLRYWMNKPFMKKAMADARAIDSHIFENIVWLQDRWAKKAVVSPSVDSLPILKEV